MTQPASAEPIDPQEDLNPRTTQLNALTRRRQTTTALDDPHPLIRELLHLRAGIRAARMKHANLLAAARATLAAHQDGEPDPCWYLRDEIAAQTAGADA
ncbi:hypothetical protein [Nonomuraea sp. NPDC050310]|uniref:hypothetical protein n=1 Tax=Nonomuraea sp. NPDC050310 TaxID=3154935 RepID=UPI0033EB03E7